jgi:type IV pilus assembly protein PilX
MNSPHTSLRHGQKGFVLITVLLLVLMLTVLAIAIVSLNTGQTRIATNAADSQVSFETAEGALNQAVQAAYGGTLAAQTYTNTVTGPYFMYNPAVAGADGAPGVPPVWTTVNWSSPTAVVPAFQGNSSTTAAYIVEQLPSVAMAGQNQAAKTVVYRITARAVGQSSNTVTMLQTIVSYQQF